jgi:VanZ family protein
MQHLLSWTVRYHRILAATIAICGFATLYIAAKTFGMTLHIGSITDHEIRPFCHFFTYGILAVIVHAALRRNIWLSWGIALTLAWGEEFHQIFVPGRYFTLDDLFVNFMAVSLFLLATHKLRLIQRVGRILHATTMQQTATA